MIQAFFYSDLKYENMLIYLFIFVEINLPR